MARVYTGENKALHPVAKDKGKDGNKAPPKDPKLKTGNDGKEKKE